MDHHHVLYTVHLACPIFISIIPRHYSLHPLFPPPFWTHHTKQSPFASQLPPHSLATLQPHDLAPDEDLIDPISQPNLSPYLQFLVEFSASPAHSPPLRALRCARSVLRFMGHTADPRKAVALAMEGAGSPTDGVSRNVFLYGCYP
jgi:hypothetical protein